MKNRVTLEYVSIVRLSADWASLVMESASSRIRILYGGDGYPGAPWPTAVDANPLILVRTTEMPRSSEALSSSMRDLIRSGP